MMWMRQAPTAQYRSVSQASGDSGQTRTADKEVAQVVRNIKSEHFRSAVWDLINLFEESESMEVDTMLPSTFARARKLLYTIPSGFPVPLIGIDPDGEVALDWIRADRTMVSVSIGPTGDPSYAAGLTDGTAYGFVRWTDRFPAALTDLLRRLYHPD